MSDQYFTVSIVNDRESHMVIFGAGIVSPATDGNNNETMLLPIGKEYGTLEELRARLHKQIDMMFDHHKDEL